MTSGVDVLFDHSEAEPVLTSSDETIKAGRQLDVLVAPVPCCTGGHAPPV